jgi:hypothetical protein
MGAGSFLGVERPVTFTFYCKYTGHGVKCLLWGGYSSANIQNMHLCGKCRSEALEKFVTVYYVTVYYMTVFCDYITCLCLTYEN